MRIGASVLSFNMTVEGGDVTPRAAPQSRCCKNPQGSGPCSPSFGARVIMRVKFSTCRFCTILSSPPQMAQGGGACLGFKARVDLVPPRRAPLRWVTILQRGACMRHEPCMADARSFVANSAHCRPPSAWLALSPLLSGSRSPAWPPWPQRRHFSSSTLLSTAPGPW